MSVAERPCGSYVTYVQGRCRCEECRQAAREQSNDYRRRKAIRDAGNANGAWVWVDAERARKHLRWLSDNGMGWQTVATKAGLSNGSVSSILYGRYERGGPPAKKIHRDTEAKILAVSADSTRLVNAAPVWEHIECMKGYGVPKYRISKALGNSGKYPPLQLSKERITRKHAERVAELHHSLFRGSEDFRGRCRCPRPASVLEESA